VLAWFKRSLLLTRSTIFNTSVPCTSSLAMLLAEERGVRNIGNLPHLSVDQVLAWADAHFQKTGQWPQQKSGPVLGASEETWVAIDNALARGLRGLPGGSSLAKLFSVERGLRTRNMLPGLSRKQILSWAKSHHERTGKWPTQTSGPIIEAPDETWSAIHSALQAGRRGLRGGSSLARLLAQHGKKLNHLDLPPLSRKKIIAWADEHHRLTGEWPKKDSGSILNVPGEKWKVIDGALRKGLRGLAGGSSLARLLNRKRGVRNKQALPALTEEEILHWADLHFQRTGTWPKRDSGEVADVPGQTWTGVEIALRRGKRGLAGGSSIAKLLWKYRDVRPSAAAGQATPSIRRHQPPEAVGQNNGQEKQVPGD
jgi:hypothetical protein